MSVLDSTTFPERTIFWDVEGEPVSFGDGSSKVWRSGTPELFSVESVIRSGVPISEERFRALARIAS